MHQHDAEPTAATLAQISQPAQSVVPKSPPAAMSSRKMPFLGQGSPPLANVRTLAEWLGMHPVTVRTMLNRGELGPYLRIGRKLFVRTASFMKWLEAREQTSDRRPGKRNPLTPDPLYVALLRGEIKPKEFERQLAQRQRRP